jgi:4-hydroxybenzoate polyprenyltransferase
VARQGGRLSTATNQVVGRTATTTKVVSPAGETRDSTRPVEDQDLRMADLTRTFTAPTPWAVAVPRSLWLSWKEARPVVQSMFQLRFAAGAVLAAPGVGLGHLSDYLLAAAAWLCATWQVYLLNGMCDQVEDRCNGSQRPLATGVLDLRAARLICRLLSVMALLLSLAVSPLSLLLVAIFLLLGWHYSAAKRPQKGNVAGFIVTVTGGGAITYLAGCTAAGGSFRLEMLVLASAMSLWMACAGMTKDLADVAGDRLAGRRTLPVVLGARRARTLIAGLTLGVAAYLLGWAVWFAPALLPAAGALGCGAVACALYSVLGSAEVSRSRQRRPYRAFMLSQYVVHFVVLLGC